MFQKARKIVAGAVAGATLAAGNAFAAISSTDEASILTGVSSSDTLYYKVGGAILVVMAGIWGFKQVRRML